MLTQSQLTFLLSADAQPVLADLASQKITANTHIQIVTKLRKKWDADAANVLVELALLRQKGSSKFSKANEMIFDSVGLEMATAEIISTYRARRYAGMNNLLDLASGIGGDAIGLAQHGTVYSVDLDPLRLQMVAHNVALYGGNPIIPLHQNIETVEPFEIDGLFFDPARRTEQGKRIFKIAQYRPPISVLDRWKPFTQNWGVKISPGFDYDDIPPEAEVELISVNGEVREGVLWYGDLRTGQARTATLLPSAIQFHDGMPESDLISEPQQYLYEPDGAIIRAGLVRQVAYLLNASRIDETIAYLTSSTAQDVPYATCFEIVDWMPFQLKRLRARLREMDIGRVIIKKRGSPLEPEQLQKQLKLKGKGSCVLFLTHVMGEPAVLIGRKALFP